MEKLAIMCWVERYFSVCYLMALAGVWGKVREIGEEESQVCLLAICEMEQGYCLNLKPL